jgi:hypothetical protein
MEGVVGVRRELVVAASRRQAPRGEARRVGGVNEVVHPAGMIRVGGDDALGERNGLFGTLHALGGGSVAKDIQSAARGESHGLDIRRCVGRVGLHGRCERQSAIERGAAGEKRLHGGAERPLARGARHRQALVAWGEARAAWAAGRSSIPQSN